MSCAPLGAKILPIKATAYPVKGKAEAPMPAEAATILEGAATEPEGVVEKLADSKLGVSS